MTLTLASLIREIDPRLAARRAGFRTKGPEAWRVLQESLDIVTVGDLLHHYPRRYIDRSRVQTIRGLKVGEYATVIARVRTVNKRLTKRRQTMVTVTLFDGTGSLDLAFFNQPWAASIYRAGIEVAVSGVVSRYGKRLQLQNQEVEVLRGEDADLVHMGRITPVHRATEGITTRTIRELVHAAIGSLEELADPMPSDVVRQEHLGPFDRAIRDIHFPEASEDLVRAQERLKFDELFVLEVGVAFRKHRVETDRAGIAHEAEGALTDKLLATLPFAPTDAQRKALEAVGASMTPARPMNVLLQGDVGSGKTLVAVHAALVAIQSGHQAAIMAPTEVLAGQHFRSITGFLESIGGVPFLDSNHPVDGQHSLLDEPGPSGVMTFALLTGAVTGKDRSRVVEGIASGAVDLVVGTHALVQEGIVFHDLSLAIVDEQHRFGLEQRAALKGKGASPDVLIMTATPIPRTLALTYYGDLDVVVLDELPKGRRPIETNAVRTPQERSSAEELVRREVAAGHRAFVVCAAIDEGNRLQVKAAEQEADRLTAEVFPGLRVEVLHGRMRPADKLATMERFRAGESDVLISTTVIEVGVDVPEATVMLVENAERFGIAQLHQLRGRIGRSSSPSFCFLVDESTEAHPEAAQRIDAVVRTTDGFELADEDLRLRGEGTLFDIRQSGLPDLKLARLAEDVELVKRARTRAFALIHDDPELERHPELLAEVKSRFEASIDWLFST